MTFKLILTAAAASALMAGAAYAQQAVVNSETIQAAPGVAADPTNPAVSSTRATMPGANTTMDDTSRAGMEAKARLSGETMVGVTTTTAMPMAEPAPAYTGSASAASSTSMGTPSVTMTTSTVTNGPVPDTAENRAKYGSPMSNAGKRTAPAGN
jgi:hypothetical protein